MATLRKKINPKLKEAHEKAGVEFATNTIPPMVLAIRALNLTAKNSLPEMTALSNARKALTTFQEMYLDASSVTVAWWP